MHCHSPQPCTKLRQPSREPLPRHSAQRAYRLLVRCSSTTAYQSPSSTAAASELQLIQRFSFLVPDSQLLGRSSEPMHRPKAATVSYGVLSGIVASESLGLRPYQNAILSAMNDDRCRSLPAAERAQCMLSKAMVNVGSLFSNEVEGRVCTEVDLRLSNDSDKMVAAVVQLLGLYKEVGVPLEKLIFRLPATWPGIQAAKQLEAKGIPTQGVAAAQAGVSVVQPNVGRTREWFRKNPGAIRDPNGPRQDAGGVSDVDPGVVLVQQLYNYVRLFHPKTKVMVSGIRTKEDALAVSGADYLVVPSKVISELAATPTAAGYNDGMHALETVEEGTEAALTPEAARLSGMVQMGPLDEKTFNLELGVAGKELLELGLKQLVEDADRVLPYFSKTITSTSSL